MTHIPGEPLGELMQRLDGTVFSHSGIAVRADGGDGPATHLASALAKDLPGRGIDVGGVRWDPFGEFWERHRDLYCIRMPDDLRRHALDYLAQFEAEPGREGTFSFVKLVTVAAALRSVELQSIDPGLAEELFDATRDLARSWAATPGRPSYYCAELVANAYGRTFTRAEMTPPRRHDRVIGDEIDEPRWLAWLMTMFAEEIDTVDRSRGQVWADLFGVLSTRDWDFLAHAVTAVAQSGVFVLGDVTGEPAVPEPLVVPPLDPDLAHATDPIPHALVTPRMLWAAFGQGTLCKVRQR